MDAQCISNTTRVCLKAMEKHFFLLPPVLWWPPLSHFRKKGIFLGLSLVSTSTLKYL